MFGENLFAVFGVVSAYTRERAIEDGVLVDANHCARDTDCNVDTVVTGTVWDRCMRGPEGSRLESGGQDEEGRLWDVLRMASVAARRRCPEPAVGAPGENLVTFKVSVVDALRHDGSPHRQEHGLRVHIGPRNAGEPVLTMFPED